MDKQAIKALLLNLGADVCGIASAEGFKDAPPGFHPRDIFSGCRSAVVFAIALPSVLYDADTRIVYNHANHLSLSEIDRITLAACRKLEAEGFKCMPVPCDSPYEHWEPERLHGRGILSMRHAAVLAGIGSMGKNTLVMNRMYGNRLNIGAFLTDIFLESDPKAEQLCLESCRRCLAACPQKALDGVTVRQDLCRPYTYATNARGYSVCNCNRCRTACPFARGNISEAKRNAAQAEAVV